MFKPLKVKLDITAITETWVADSDDTCPIETFYINIIVKRVSVLHGICFFQIHSS